MNKTWVIVANSLIGYVFAINPKDRQLQLIRKLNSQEALSSKLVNSTSQTKTNLHQRMKKRFVSRLIMFLKDRKDNYNFNALILIAPEEFLDIVRKKLPRQIYSRITNEINRDLTHSTKNEILKYIINN